MLEVFVVCKGIPTARLVRIGMADVGTEYPEGRVRPAAGISAVCISTAVEVTACFRTVDAPIKGQAGCSQLPLRTQAKDVGNVHILAVRIPCTVGFYHAGLVEGFSRRTEVPCYQAQVIVEFLTYLNEGRSVDCRYDILFYDIARNHNTQRQ